MRKFIKSSTTLILSLLICLCIISCNNSNYLLSNDSTNTYQSRSIITSSSDVKISSAPNQKAPVSSSLSSTKPATSIVTINDIPTYSDKPYIALNNNYPTFAKSELTTKAYEHYGPLDNLGRCTQAFAVCGTDIMPKNNEQRGSISSIKPSGWVQAKYNGISGGYLYNRCHLIGWQLSAENANIKNLITGTRYMNTEGMLPFENMVADYIKETNNHVAYRITPIFSDDNLLCSGVQMEAFSVEDNGEGICFNVYCYNVQPNINIDYKTGKSSITTTQIQSSSSPQTIVSSKAQLSVVQPATQSYTLNNNTNKFHYTDCRHANTIKKENREDFQGDRQELIYKGYSPCKTCKP